MEVNQEQRAFYTWAILTKTAKNNTTITYGELGEQINVHPRAIRFILEIIQDFCLSNGLQPLTILVLNKNTRLPGNGFIAYDIKNPKDGIKKVQNYNWEQLENPFEYAKTGLSQQKIINSLIENPSNSKEVFVKIKSRGIIQRIFRSTLLKIYKNKCAICGLSFSKALEAAHIIPYSEATPEQRLDIRNGLLLCSTHHKLFDSNWISINQDYSINYSKKLLNKKTYSEYDKLMTINLDGKMINLPSIEKHKPKKEYLKQHQDY